MDNTTLKNIFKFLEEKGEHKIPIKWKVLNNIPLTVDDFNGKDTFNLSHTNIMSLPEGLKIHGHLSLYKTKITLLPEGLEVGEHLYLNDTKIKSLPEGLKVGGDLYIQNTKIKSLPEGLQVGGDLFINSTPLTKYLDDDLRQMVKPGFIKGIIYR
jgi:hypothetical protein